MHAPAIEIGIATSGTNTVRTDHINRKTTIATIAIVSAKRDSTASLRSIFQFGRNPEPTRSMSHNVSMRRWKNLDLRYQHRSKWIWPMTARITCAMR